MIFSRLFNTKNKWQAKDSNVRIAAINELLSINNAEQKTVLLSMLAADKSELVRRAALLKLNDFDAYVLASQRNDNKAVKNFALAQVSEILANKHDISLTVANKAAFLQQDTSKGFLSAWLEQEQEPSLVVELFNQLSQHKHAGHLFMQIFMQKQATDIQESLLSLSLPELSETNFLTKLLKKSASTKVNLLLSNKLAQLLEVKEKPIKLQKELQLVLSKLLALKDLADYGRYQGKRNELEVQWQQGLTSFACLSTEQQELLTHKYQKITEQLTQLFAPKAEFYQQEKIAQQLELDKKTAREHFSAAIADINQVITTSVFEDQNLDQQALADKFNQLEQRIGESVLNEQERAKFIAQIGELSLRLTQLPEIAQSVSDATHLISKISQLSLPQTLGDLNDRINTYHQWLDQWRRVEKKALGVLPQSIKEAHQQITRLWQQGLKPLQAEQKQLFVQSKKKLLDIKRLLASGKYKVCFGLFKGVKQALPLFSTTQQQQLQRDFDSVSAQMAEISDWEHYIATPRKQQLLTQVTELVQSPLDNPYEQAEKVKHFRKVWNSLGHADEAMDKDLNEQFNQASEQAFAPCRLFYAEQEKLRGQHLIERNALIEQAKQIAHSFNEKASIEQSEQEQAIQFKTLDGQLNKLQQAWQQAGEVDRKEYQPLQKQFRQLQTPMKEAIKAYHLSNSTKKTALIKQAQLQLATDDVFHAIEKIKQLQQQWRDVGFAGSRQENKLWQEFRQVNDEIFAKRELIKTEQHSAHIALTAQFKQGLADIAAQVGVAPNKSTVNQAKQDAEQLLSSLLEHKPVIKSVAVAIESFIKSTQQQLENIIQQECQASWVSLFALLTTMAKSASPVAADELSHTADFIRLTSFWQKRLHEHAALTKVASTEARNVKTLTIEILAQRESPTALAQQRMAVQVQLMQEQMQSSAEIDLNQQLIDWLTLGKLTEQDLSMIARLQRVFIS